MKSTFSVGIIIITDGVMSVPDVAVCETLLNQLKSGTVACSFVQVSCKVNATTTTTTSFCSYVYDYY